MICLLTQHTVHYYTPVLWRLSRCMWPESCQSPGPGSDQRHPSPGSLGNCGDSCTDNIRTYTVGRDMSLVSHCMYTATGAKNCVHTEEASDYSNARYRWLDEVWIQFQNKHHLNPHTFSDLMILCLTTSSVKNTPWGKYAISKVHWRSGECEWLNVADHDMWRAHASWTFTLGQCNYCH